MTKHYRSLDDSLISLVQPITEVLQEARSTLVALTAIPVALAARYRTWLQESELSRPPKGDFDQFLAREYTSKPVWMQSKP
jgi:hypothetical protein